MRHLLAILLLMSGLGSKAAIAQAIVLNPNDIFPVIAERGIEKGFFYVNGPMTEGMNQKAASTHVPLGSFSRYMLALIALRLADEELLDLTKPVSRILPEVIEENPFIVEVTPLHLLTQTAGFATPPQVSMNAKTPLASLAIQIRGAGQLSVDDPASWAVLIRLMEAVSGKPLKVLVAEHILTPLSLEAGNLHLNTSLHGLNLRDSTADGTFIAELSRLMVRNRDKTGALYLSHHSWSLLTKMPSFQLHPMASAQTLGLTMHEDAGQTWLQLPDIRYNPGPRLFAFPTEGVAFAAMETSGCCFEKTLQQGVLALAQKHFPPHPDNRLADSRKLSHTIFQGGRYVTAEQSPSWLRERLALMQEKSLYVLSSDKGLQVRNMKGETSLYQPIAPYYYQTDDREELILSPYKNGGYLLMGGKAWRHIGLLGNPDYVIRPLPWVLAIMLTSLVYIRSKTGKAWRRMALFGFGGTILVVGGLACELYLWPHVLYKLNMIFPIIFWRLALNIGLMLVLSVPLFALSFLRDSSKMPQKGWALLLAGPHIGLLSLAAISLFLILVAWGVAGTVGPY